MNKLTAESALMELTKLKVWENDGVLTLKEERYLQALEIALPVLEQDIAGYLLEYGGIDREFFHTLVDAERMRREVIENGFLQVKLSRVIIGSEVTRAPTTPQIDNDGWINWGGGECPVENDAKIEVKFRDGDTKTSAQANNCLVWKDRGFAADIIAYRVIENDGREG